MKVSEIQSHSVSHQITVPFLVHWSEDDIIATATDKGIQIMKSSLLLRRKNLSVNCNRYKSVMNIQMKTLLYIIPYILLIIVQPAVCNDITKAVFGSVTDGMPAAFGDFDSDKFTDLFVLRDNASTVEILLGDDTEPLLRQSDGLKCTFNNSQKITSVVPGDFNGDAFMDILVTVRDKTDDQDHSINSVFILWGNGSKVNCSVSQPLFKMIGQPLAVDWNQDMIVDLFGLNLDNKRGFWILNKNRTISRFENMILPNHMKEFTELKIPHSHAFLDLNHDSYGDLYLTTIYGNAEVWLYNVSQKNFIFSEIIELPPGVEIDKKHYIGQTVFQDMALEGKLDQLIPVCFDSTCKNSTIYLRSKEHWHNIKVQFNDWHFVHPENKDDSQFFLKTLTLRAGDFNMDGFPDLLATLVCNGVYRTHLLENVECNSGCDGFPRTFRVQDVLSPYNNNTVLGVFYDFLQDGVLDIILVHDKPKRRVSAFRNSLDYDANFVKVMVLTGLTNDKQPAVFHTPLGKKQRIYGTNLPGPTILYHTTTQEGNPRSAISTQLPQSAYFSLNLPYTIFGLGRTPNFVDELIVGAYGHYRVWTQLIPNSQMVVIPSPTYDPTQWKVQLFVTPSKLILQSVFALLGTCALISLIIGALYWKERKEDHKEKLQEAQKFHFDAM
ncbi:T-cell immunomodulatory protein isoform X2 [Lycorma delicatula]|uniref:T-cell immunomodulatory protein isoform X2 n=1 Tax=Lycorma delicatula TaxID=130591 RepID=UPI003F518F5B